MFHSTMVLVSRDATLIESLRGVVRTIDRLRLTVVGGVEGARGLRDWDDVGLVVVHSEGNIAGAKQVIRMVAALKRPVATLVLGDDAHPQSTLAMLRLGAAEYLSRPLDLGRLAYLIDVLTIRARHHGLSTAPRAKGPTATPPISTAPCFYHSSPEMGRMMEQVRRVAGLDATVLLSGETGTGKTRLARYIHEHSPRRDQPFLVVNCGALSSNLIESEMFGHVRGAFTGADRDRVGKFAEVGRGTMFLDEVDSLPADVQAKLLRVVEERVFEPVGCNKPQQVRARLIAASNRDLKHEVTLARFRADLFYRLNVIGFTLPPLRDRPQLIAPLAMRFAVEFADRDSREPRVIADEAMHCLEAHSWPGNIRELRNVIERAVALSHGPEIQPEDLPDAIRDGEASSLLQLAATPAARPAASTTPRDSTLAQTRGQAELSRITQALKKHRNNRLRAAGELGISRMTLYKKLYKYGLINEAVKAHGGSGAGGVA